MKPAAFTYRCVDSAEAAVAALAELGDDAKLIAGGQSLVPLMNFRLARPEALVDISRLDDLRYVREDGGDGVRVGALARHRDLEGLPKGALPGALAVLPKAAKHIGHYTIRASGTFGGSLAHADPASEWCMIALLFDAEITVLGPRGSRVLHAGGFFRGFLETALAADEMIVEVRVGGGWDAAAIQEVCRRQGDFAVTAAAVAIRTNAGGSCEDARVVLGGVGGTVVRSAAAEAALEGRILDEESMRDAGTAAARDIDPPSDLHGPPEYRRRLADVMVRRSLAEAADALVPRS